MARRSWPGDNPGFDLDITGRTVNGYFRVSKNPDKAEQKSVSEQRAEYLEQAAQSGLVLGRDWADDDRSASRYARKQREGFADLRDWISSGRLDGQVLWFWSSSRQTRGDIPLDVLRDESEAHGIVWITARRVLNPACEDDMFHAGVDHLMDRRRSADISKDVRRGKRGSALAGKPSSGAAYGYRRVHALGEDGQPVVVKGRPVIAAVEPDALGEDGQPVPGTPAAIVAEIFARTGAGDSLSAIARDLAARQVRVPKFPIKCTTCGQKLADRECPNGHEQDLTRWNVTTVRSIAANPAYIGRRVYRAETADGKPGHTPKDRLAAVLDGVTTMWPALVEDGRFWAVHRIITDPARLRYPGGRAGAHLLSTTARCGVCGSPLGYGRNASHKDGRYSCTLRGCISISAPELEAWAEGILVSWLIQDEVSGQIWGSTEQDAQARAARADRERLEAEHEDLKRRVRLGPARGGVSLAMAAAAEAGITEQIEEAEAIIRAAETPTALVRELIGPDAAHKWYALKTASPRDARALLAEVATIYAGPAPRMGVAGPIGDRARWHWNIGPDASSPAGLPFAGVAAQARESVRQAKDAAAELLKADPAMSSAVIARKAGCDPATVQRVRAELLAAGEITEPGYRLSQSGRRYSLAAHPRWRA